MANYADEALTASDLVMHIKKARRAIAHLACEFDGAPGRIRTVDTRFRRVIAREFSRVLYGSLRSPYLLFPRPFDNLRSSKFAYDRFRFPLIFPCATGDTQRGKETR